MPETRLPREALPPLGIALACLAVALLAGPAPGQTPDLYDEGVFRTFELTFADPVWYITLATSYPSETYFKADLKVDDITYKDVGVRFRGWSTYRLALLKKPFKISMDAFVPGQNLYGYRTLDLNNGGNDPTFMREVLTYHIFRKYSPAPKANWVKLVVNTVNIGVYVNVQPINKDFGREWFKNEDGNRYQAELHWNAPANGSALVWLGTRPESYQYSYDLKNEKSPDPWLDVIAVCDVLNNRTLTEMEQQLPGLLSVQSALWMLALNNVVDNPDTYYFLPHNYYLYFDVFQARMHLLSWDMDLSFSCTWQDNWKMDPFHMSTDPNRPLISRLLQVPRWKETYLAHCRTVLENDLRWDVLGPLVAKWQALIDKEVQADPIRIFSYEAFKANVTQNTEERSGLKPMVDTRRAYLLGLDAFKRPLPAVSGVHQTPGKPTASSEVWVTAAVKASAGVQDVFLNYRTRGPFLRVQMHDDGKHHDGAPGDGVGGGRIPPQGPGQQVDYFLEARCAASAGGAMVFEPRTAAHAPFTFVVEPGLRVSEFLAVNNTGIRDEKGEQEDWIEILNPTGQTLPLDGLYLTDNLSKPTRWKFPAGHSLAPDATLLVWADNEAGDGPLHATFKLSGGGEEIALFDRDGKTPLDAVAFGPQHHDVSTGRVPGFPGVWVTFPASTPWAENRPVPCGHLAYGGLRSSAAFDLAPLGTPRIASVVSYKVGKAPPSTPGLLALSPAPFEGEVGALGTLLLDPSGLVLLGILTDASGTATPHISIPAAPALVGAVFYLQAFVYDGKAGGFSAGVMTRICP